MSDTPRTREETRWYETGIVHACFAAQLERELNAANARIDLLEACNADVARIAEERNEALKRIKRLEKAGDAILKAYSKDPDAMCFDDWVCMTADVRANWHKAKEAKP